MVLSLHSPLVTGSFVDRSSHTHEGRGVAYGLIVRPGRGPSSARVLDGPFPVGIIYRTMPK